MDKSDFIKNKMDILTNKKVNSNLSKNNGERLLSIVIPTFNRQYQLIQLLEQLSVELEGERDKVEIIVSDNNSSDQTWDSLQEYVASQTDKIAIRCFAQQANIGAALNINFLIKQSRATYTWTIADDDFLVPGRLHDILKLLNTNLVNLLLVRVSGIYEWDGIPKRTIERNNKLLHKVKLCDKNSADYLFSGAFLGSIIMNTQAWVNALPEAEKLHETFYPQWVAVLRVASTVGEYFIVDQACVKGNFNMRGECLIPGFDILIAGRLKIWSTFTGEPIQKILSHKVKELAYMGWALIALGRVNDVVTLSDKIHALRVTISLLGVQGFKAYFFAFISIVFPFTSVLRRIQMVASSYLKVKK